MKNISQNISKYANVFRTTMFSGRFSQLFRIIKVCQCFFILNILLDTVFYWTNDLYLHL